MEKEIEKILNNTFYLHIKVKFIDYGIYDVEIGEMKKKVTYNFDFGKFNFYDNIKEIEKIICQEIINYYKVGDESNV